MVTTPTSRTLGSNVLLGSTQPVLVLTLCDCHSATASMVLQAGPRVASMHGLHICIQYASMRCQSPLAQDASKLLRCP